MNKTITLICKRVIFFSQIDEDLFFDWIARIKVIDGLKGVIDEIHLYVKENNITFNDIREINALFERYKIDRDQLKIFVNEENKHWLVDFLSDDE